MRNIRGFSAMEVIIVVAISAVILMAVTEIYVTYNDSYIYQNASINNAASAAQYLGEFSDLGLQADAVATSRTVSGTTYTTGSTTVIFELPSINSSGDVISNTYDYAIFYSSGSDAYRILDVNGVSARVGGTKKFSDAVDNLTFTYDSATPASVTTVTADITTKSVVKQETFTTHLKQQVYLRNK